MQSTQIGELAHLSLNIKILYFFPNICQNLIPWSGREYGIPEPCP